MLDVHAPHGRMEGLRDFLLHLLTITIGLLIALGLEGCVGWQHHRNLVHEAEDGMRGEVAQNLGTVTTLQKQIADHQKELDADLAVIAGLRTQSRRKGSSRSGSRSKALLT